MLEKLKTRAARYIARRRQWTSVEALHHVADFIERAYDNDEWDMAANGELEVVRRLSPARFRTVVDAGAHVGDWSLTVLREWPQATVHAFEVAPVTYDRLVQRVASSGLAERVVMNAVGLSDAPGSQQMYYFPEHPNLTCNQPRHLQFQSTPFAATLTRGDEYMRVRGLDEIDFLKIDVEGAEHLVLRGFRDALAGGKIHCVQFEYGAFSIQTHVLLADYYELLAAHYWIGKIYPSYVDFRDYDWRMENFRFCNYLGVSRARADLRALLTVQDAA